MRVGNRLRSTAAALGIVVLASLSLLAIGVGSAGAQLTTPDTPCQYTVSPVTLPPGGGFVTVAGTAPGDAEVRIFANGIFQASVRSDPVDGTWSATFRLPVTSEITVAIDDYPATGCSVNTEAQQAINQRTGAGSLPRTGSDHVESTVLVALALVVVGAALVVAMRRHEGLRGRN
jgi:LPXTG-motif cell wall-anchored protein